MSAAMEEQQKLENAETLSQIGNNTLAKLCETISANYSNYTNAIAAIQRALERFGQVTQIIGEITTRFSSHLSTLIEHIHIPQISEERKEELRINYEIWGNYGWTIVPYAEISIYNKAPVDMADANKQMKQWCSREYVETLFDMIKNIKGATKNDFEEAIYLFKAKQYKPCAMMLFALLDAKLIRMQKNEDRSPKNNRRPCGDKAIENVKKRVESELDINKKLFLLLSYSNLFACLKKVFEDGHDFKQQPDVINRNFLQHGMQTRRVRKRDCIQLFLLYYNFLDFFTNDNY